MNSLQDQVRVPKNTSIKFKTLEVQTKSPATLHAKVPLLRGLSLWHCSDCSPSISCYLAFVVWRSAPRPKETHGHSWLSSVTLGSNDVVVVEVVLVVPSQAATIQASLAMSQFMTSTCWTEILSFFDVFLPYKFIFRCFCGKMTIHNPNQDVEDKEKHKHLYVMRPWVTMGWRPSLLGWRPLLWETENKEKEARSSSFLILVAVPLLLVASSYRKVGGHVSISPEPPERPAALVMELVVVELIVTVLLVMVELVALTTKQTKSTCELLWTDEKLKEKRRSKGVQRSRV